MELAVPPNNEWPFADAIAWTMSVPLSEKNTSFVLFTATPTTEVRLETIV